MRRSRSLPRAAVLMIVVAVLAAACSSDGGSDVSTDPTGGDGTSTEDGTSGASGDAFTYQTGIFEEPTTDNYWAYLDPDSSVWNGYILAPTKCALYTVEFPDVEVVADLAADDEVPEPEPSGDGASVTVKLKDGLEWSDGEPLTAADVAFTYATVRDLELGGNWLTSWPYPSEDDPEATAVTAVEAVDDTTVRIDFNQPPGLGVWPTQAGLAPILAQHFWGSTVEEAKGSDDPATTLYEASGAGDPSCGPVTFEEIEAGAFARVSANAAWHLSGDTFQIDAGDGGEAAEGPYLSDEVLSLYGGQDPAVLALQQGEVDYLYNPLGMQRGLREKVVSDESLTAISNPDYGFRYLAFNFRKPPMNDKAFRQALATMIDREFMAESVLQGVALPLFTIMPESNPFWYDEEAAASLREPFTGFESQERRLEAAVQILEDAGYTWQTKPSVTVDDGGTPDDPSDDAETINNGAGLTMPDGTAVPELELLAPGPGYDPLRSTYSVWIQQWAEQLGIPLTAKPTNFNVIVEKVFVEDPPTFDIYILGWSLGTPTFNTSYEDFFSTGGGSNVMDYSNEEYDAAVRDYLATTDEAEARRIIWERLEPIVAEDLPYVVLFTTPILEFYRSESVAFPFTQTLSGIQYGNGFKSLVRASQ